MELGPKTILRLARLRDPLGVLSIYVDADPAQKASSSRPWDIVVGNELRDLERQVKEVEIHDRWPAIAARLEELEPEINSVLDPATTGRGRALFACIEATDVYRLSFQLPVPTSVTLRGTAFLLPLLDVFETGRPGGLVTVSRSGATLHDWRFGAMEEAARWSFDEPTSEWRKLTGPAAANPARAQQTATQRDRFDRRLEEHQIRFLGSLADQIDEVARGRNWSTLLVSGNPRLTARLTETLPKDRHYELTIGESLLEGLPPDELEATIYTELKEAREQNALRISEEIREGALAGGQGALGLEGALAALTEGRVETLVLNREGVSSAASESAARRFGEAQSSDWPDPDDVDNELHLTDWMIESAFGTGASVVLVHGRASELLSDLDGVGALLRW